MCYSNTSARNGTVGINLLTYLGSQDLPIHWIQAVTNSDVRRQAMYVESHIGVLSRNYCYCGNAISITHYACVSSLSYPELKVLPVYYIVVMIFERTVTEQCMSVLIFSVTVYEIFIIPKRTERDIIINVHWSSCTAPAIYFIF